jgi:hypothetical protein
MSVLCLERLLGYGQYRRPMLKVQARSTRGMAESPPIHEAAFMAYRAVVEKGRMFAEATDTAKKPETRTRRIARAVAAIRQLPGKKK